MKIKFTIILLSILLGLSLGLNTLYYQKIQNIIIYNKKQKKEIEEIIKNNNQNNINLNNYIKSLSNNINENYKDYIKSYKMQKEIEFKQYCFNLFKDDISAIIVYPSKKYLEFVFYKFILENKDRLEKLNNIKFHYTTINYIKYVLSKNYGYYYAHGQKKINRANLLNYYFFIKTLSKYNLIKLNFVPFVWNENMFLTYLANLYYINKINLNKYKKNDNKYYVDVIYYYYIKENKIEDIRNKITQFNNKEILFKNDIKSLKETFEDTAQLYLDKKFILLDEKVKENIKKCKKYNIDYIKRIDSFNKFFIYKLNEE